MIPFLDIRAHHEDILSELIEKAAEVIRSGRYAGGPEVEGFEHEFAHFVGAEHCAGVASGTDALQLAFLALGVRPGDEIITVPQTFIATAEAIVYSGAQVKFVDVDPETHTMDPRALAAAVGPRTVGIVPVHLYGRPADMDPILAIARDCGLWVVEDAAQAHGARYKGRPIGTLADAACFSFYPGKNLGALGEAGAVVSHDAGLIDRVRTLRDHGQRRKYVHELVGLNGRLDALQAAMLRVKLRRLDDWNEGRRRAAGWYGELLQDGPHMAKPVEPAYAESVYHLYAIQSPRRDELAAWLGERGIGTGMHYPIPLHLQGAFSALGHSRGEFPAAERIAAQTLSLPMYPMLTVEQVRAVAESVHEFFSVGTADSSHASRA